MSTGIPLKDSVQQSSIDEVMRFINRHIEPDEKPEEKTHTGYDWFYEYFSFVPEPNIREHFAQAYYQSRFVHKLLIALKLSGRESMPLLLLQLFEYASLYEALTDYLIERKFESSSDFKPYKVVKEIRKYPALNSNSWRLIFHKDEIDEPIFFAYEKDKSLQLRDIRFSDRIRYLGKKIGLTDPDATYIAKIYDLRNHIHLLKAADDNFVPSHEDCKKAFRILRKFIENVRMELNKP